MSFRRVGFVDGSYGTGSGSYPEVDYGAGRAEPAICITRHGC